MFKCLAAFIIFVSTTSFAQKIPDHPGGNPYTFEEVVTVDSTKSKAILFNNARSWYNNSYKSSKDVLQINDKETGELAGKGSYRIHKQYATAVGMAQYLDGFLTYSIKVFSKDGKYKFVLSDFVFDPIDSKTPVQGPVTDAAIYTNEGIGKKYYNKAWEVLKEITNEHVSSLAESLKKAMNGKLESDF